MADYSFGFGGVGSGLDISTMVNQLVAADRAPHDARLTKLESAAKFKLSGLATVSSAFDALKTALDALQKADALSSRSVSVTAVGNADNKASPSVTATVSKSTPVGTYEVEVLSLASAHKLVGEPVDTGARFAGGTLQVSIGTTLVDVEIAADASLADVRDAINAAAGKHGLQATLLGSDGGQHLSLASTRTGAEHAIAISVRSGDSDNALQGLVDGLQERSPAADARVSIDGLVSSSADNSLANAVPGLTLAIKELGTSKVLVTADAAGSRAAVDSFIKAYNGALNAIATSTKYDKDTDTPSALTGDAQMRGAAAQLRAVMSEMLGSLAAQGLDAATIGLQTQGHPNPNGNLVLDAAKFDKSLAENPALVIGAFTGEDGLAARVANVVKGYVGSDGSFTLRKKGLDDQVKDVAKQRETLQLRMDAVAARYKAQFLALDTLMSQMTSTSSSLAQQLDTLAAQLKSG